MRRAALFHAGLLLLFFSCRPFIPRPPELLPPAALLVERAQHPAVTTLKAMARVTVSSPKRSGTFSQVLAAQEPSSLRLEGLGPLGNIFFIVALQGRHMRAYSAHDNVFYEGSATGRNVARFLPFALSPEAVVSLALGRGSLMGPKQGSLTVSEERKGIVLSYLCEGAPGRQKIVFDRETLEPVTSALYDEKDSVVLSISYSGYTYIQGTLFPERLRITIPSETTIVSIVFKDITLNAPIEDRTFTLPIPSDAEKVPLDE